MQPAVLKAHGFVWMICWTWDNGYVRAATAGLIWQLWTKPSQNHSHELLCSVSEVQSHTLPSLSEGRWLPLAITQLCRPSSECILSRKSPQLSDLFPRDSLASLWTDLPQLSALVSNRALGPCPLRMRPSHRLCFLLSPASWQLQLDAVKKVFH